MAIFSVLVRGRKRRTARRSVPTGFGVGGEVCEGLLEVVGGTPTTPRGTRGVPGGNEEDGGFSGLGSLRGVGLGLILLAGICLGDVRAQEAVVLDFPAKGFSVLPMGLAAEPKEITDGLVGVEIPLLALSDEGSVLVSVVFLDDETRVVRAKWISAGETTVLANNLSEGVRGWNQRMVRLPYDLLQQPGSLILETDAEVLPVRRVTLAWMWPGGVYMGTAAHTVEYMQSAKRVFTERDFAEAKVGAPPDAWSGGIWRAALQEEPESVKEGLQFVVPMNSVPRAAVFRARVLGLGFSDHLVLWINGRRVEPLSVEIPELSSSGYFQAPEGRMGFAGWREAAVVLPAAAFQVGENAIILEAAEGVYIKDTLLELSFEEEGAPMNLNEVMVGEETAREEVEEPPFEDILSGLEETLEPGEEAKMLEPVVITNHSLQ